LAVAVNKNQFGNISDLEPVRGEGIREVGGVGRPDGGAAGIGSDDVTILTQGELVRSRSLSVGVGRPERLSARHVGQDDVAITLDLELGLPAWRDQDLGRGDDGADAIRGEKSVTDGSGGGLLSVHKDVVLGTIGESIVVLEYGGALGVYRVSHVVALVVGPIERLEGLGADGGRIAPVGVQVAGGLAITTDGGNGLANNPVGWVLDVALESGHVHLVGSTNGVVDPEPSADALAVGAGRKGRNIEGLELASNAVMDDREDDEV